MPHDHDYRIQSVNHTERWEGLEWKVVTKQPTCACGHIRPTRTGLPRPPDHAQSRPGTQPPPEDAVAKAVATILVRASPSMRWGTLLQRAGGQYREDNLLMACFALAKSGGIRIKQKWATKWQPHRITIEAPQFLEDVANPGKRKAWHKAVETASKDLPDTPAAVVLRSALAKRPGSWTPDTVRLASALIHHQAQGRSSLARVLSAELGDSKLLGRHEGRLETVLGDLTDYGIRRVDDLLLVCGTGVLEWPDTRISLVQCHGVLGLERERLRQLVRTTAVNVLFVENKSAFTAIAEGLHQAPPGLIFYMAGNFGSTITHLLRVAEGKPLMWADLDPFGVRFTRRAHTIRPDLEPYCMDPNDLLGPATRKMPPSYAKALQEEKTTNGILQDALELMADRQVVLEQEAQVRGRDTTT